RGSRFSEARCSRPCHRRAVSAISLGTRTSLSHMPHRGGVPVTKRQANGPRERTGWRIVFPPSAGGPRQARAGGDLAGRAYRVGAPAPTPDAVVVVQRAAVALYRFAGLLPFDIKVGCAIAFSAALRVGYRLAGLLPLWCRVPVVTAPSAICRVG